MGGYEIWVPKADFRIANQFGNYWGQSLVEDWYLKFI